jgi:hypothetical protein
MPPPHQESEVDLTDVQGPLIVAVAVVWRQTADHLLALSYPGCGVLWSPQRGQGEGGESESKSESESREWVARGHLGVPALQS